MLKAETHPERISWQNLAAAITIQTAASMPTWLSPLVVGSVIDRLGFSGSQAGLIASADVMGVLIATAAALWWVDKFSWHLIAWPAAILAVCLNLGSVFCSHFESLFVLRLCFGLVVGSLMATCGATLGASNQPERSVALLTGVQFIVASLLLLKLPAYIAGSGPATIYLTLTFLTIIGLLLVPLLPNSAPMVRQHTVGAGTNIQKDTGHQKIPGKLLLLAVALPGFLFHIGVSATWAFSERIAVDTGLDPGQAGQALSLAMLAGIVGSLMAYVAGIRFGRFLPLLLILGLQLFALWLLLIDIPGMVQFSVALALLGLSFNAAVSYQFGLAIKLLPGPLTPVAYLLMLKFGMICGPILSSVWVRPDNHLPALWIGGLFFAISFAVVCKQIRGLKPSAVGPSH